jgi:hypothetical protein
VLKSALAGGQVERPLATQLDLVVEQAVAESGSPRSATRLEVAAEDPLAAGGLSTRGREGVGPGRWMVSGQMQLGLGALDSDLYYTRSGELGLRLSRDLKRGWSLGLAVSGENERGYGAIHKRFLDLTFERGWTMNERFRIVAFGGASAAHVTSSDDELNLGRQYGFNAGLAFEIRLGGNVWLRPEVRRRFISHDRFGLLDSDVGSVGIGIRF